MQFRPHAVRVLAVSVVVLAGTGCQSGPKAVPAHPAAPPPTFAVEHLLGACWPEGSDPEQRVALTLIRDGHALKDVLFETRNGAPNSVGRCLRQVVWLYPWRGDLPETVEFGPPQQRPNGWAVLEHVRLLASGTFGPERGLVDPIPLVHACVTHGSGVRPGVVFHVQPRPIRVQPLIAGIGSTFTTTAAITDSERCIQAVLGSTVYPGTRTFLFDFSRGTAPGEPAPLSEVSQYFEPPDLQDATGLLELAQARAVLKSLQPQVGQCWETAINRRGGISGGRTLRIRVQPTGQIAFAQVVSDHGEGTGAEAVDYLLDRCLAATILQAKIPPPEGGPAELAWSWVFALRQ